MSRIFLPRLAREARPAAHSAARPTQTGRRQIDASRSVFLQSRSPDRDQRPGTSRFIKAAKDGRYDDRDATMILIAFPQGLQSKKSASWNGIRSSPVNYFQAIERDG